MNQKELNETIQALRMEIMDVLLNADLTKDKQAKKTLKTIDKMFERIGADVEDVIPQEVLENYFAGVDEATNSLANAGVDPKYGTASAISSGEVTAAFKTHAHMEAIGKITDDTMMDLKAAIRTAKKSANKSISNALDSVKNDLQKGIIEGKARKVTTQRVAESFTKSGMTSFATVDGKKLPLDFYSQTVTRTNLKKANTKGAASRYDENGVKLFTVSGNDPTCGECAPLRGIVFSMDTDNDEFPYMDPEDIHRHPNCQCSIQPFVREYKSQSEIDKAKQDAAGFDPDKDTRSASQKSAYKKQQRLTRQNNYEKKRYADIKGLLGDDAPANLGSFKRMKRANTDNYNKLIQDYQGALKTIK